MKELLISAFQRIAYPLPFRVVFPDGTTLERGGGRPVFVLHFRTERSMFDTLRRGSLGSGESYMAEEVNITGDFQQAVRLGFLLHDHHVEPSLFTKLQVAAGYLMRRNTLQGSRRNIASHYDLGNDFYSLWLDREAMQYTCAYFHNERDSIERAQAQKLHLICRKLRLNPGQSVVEAGCGWGGFALFAARNYGVKVLSFNISQEQVAFARERARRAGIPDSRVEYVLDDYRNIPQRRIQFDRFVSIGMLEHVGLENYGGLYDVVRRVVRPNGMALVHSISRVAPRRMDPWMEKYIFPGAYIPSLSEIVTPLERVRDPLHVVDVENLRYHYALTLDRWVERLEEQADPIRRQYGEAFFRMFRLYLHSSAAGFRYGGVLLYQLLLSNGFDDRAPLTREHFHADVPQAQVPAGRRNGSNSRVARKAHPTTRGRQSRKAASR